MTDPLHPAQDGPQMLEPVEAEDLIYDLLAELAGVDTHNTNLRDHPAAWAAVDRYTEALDAHRHALAVAAERERWRVRVEQAYREGYLARETYNDAEVSDVDEKWARTKAGLLGPNNQQPATGKEPR